MDLESLIEQRKAAEAAEKKALEGATGIFSQYAPSPFREVGLSALAVILSLVGARGHYQAREAKALTVERSIGVSVVKSLDSVGLTAEQLAKIKQGPKAKALVDEAQGKV